MAKVCASIDGIKYIVKGRFFDPTGCSVQPKKESIESKTKIKAEVFIVYQLKIKVNLAAILVFIKIQVNEWLR